MRLLTGRVASFDEASSINFRRSVRYGFGCLITAGQLFLARAGLFRHARFPPEMRGALARPAGNP